MELRIISTLKAIQDRLPGIKMYRRIYDENHELDRQLQSSIVDAYASFVDFCLAALEFYTMSRVCELLCLAPSSLH